VQGAQTRPAVRRPPPAFRQCSDMLASRRSFHTMRANAASSGSQATHPVPASMPCWRSPWLARIPGDIATQSRCPFTWKKCTAVPSIRPLTDQDARRLGNPMEGTAITATKKGSNSTLSVYALQAVIRKPPTCLSPGVELGVSWPAEAVLLSCCAPCRSCCSSCRCNGCFWMQE
jgi:hypothetical protein